MTPLLLRTLSICAGLALCQTAHAEDEGAVSRLLNEAADDCAAFESGTFEAGGSVQEVDLDGDDATDFIIDSSKFSCSSMASAYCGSGGCAVWAVIGQQTWQFQAEGWRMIAWADRPILLIARDGGWCGGAGAQLCFEAVTWSSGDMLTVMPPQ